MDKKISDWYTVAIKQLLSNIKNKGKDKLTGINEQKKKIVVKIKQHKDSIKNIKPSKIERHKDKFFYTFVACVLQMSLYMLGRYPHDHMFQWNLFMTVPLMVLKYITYRKNKWHYFFTDFCYFGNVFIYVFVFFFPNSRFMYVSSYVYGTGIMAWGIVGFWNSLVLHDLDRMSSLLIHIVPLKMVWSIHWHTSRVKEGKEFWNPEEGITFWEFLFWPSLFFFAHHIFWLFFNFILKDQKIKNQGYENSFTHFTNSGKGGNLKNKVGEKKTRMIFSGINFTYYFLCSLTTWLMFNFYIANTLWVVFLTIWAAKNGASYYMEYFSKRYEANLKLLETVEGEISD